MGACLGACNYFLLGVLQAASNTARTYSPMASSNIQAKLGSLDVSFGELETLLAPLLSQGLPETLLELETLQQAKLQTLLPYLLYDLTFVYLKSRGIDPRKHQVVPELERVKQYFNKISSAEKGTPPRAPAYPSTSSSSKPSKPSTNRSLLSSSLAAPPSSKPKKPRAPPRTEPTTAIDKDAVGRFIKHAIASVRPTTLTPADAEPVPSTWVPPVVTSKMRERAEYERALRAHDGEISEEELLEMFDDAGDDGGAEGDAADEGADGDGDVQMSDAPAEPKRDVKGKGKASAEDSGVSTGKEAGKKRRRAIDPFTGNPEDSPSPAASSPAPASKPRKSKKKKSADSPAIDTSGAVSPSSGPGTPVDSDAGGERAAKRARKKVKKAAKSSLAE
ncbi:hypothetical protein HGRIS_008412 [Hohenbuehelia grisea]|uniref:Exosome complex protein n=1 Tax=Hohenbuehelia grisea TaxID=104357 RepID=A0ABR3J7W2_9AGAR